MTDPCAVPECRDRVRYLRGRHTVSCGGDGVCSCCCHTGGAWRPPCDTVGEHGGEGCGPHEPSPQCTGCLPAPPPRATHGLLCGGSYNRLASALTIAPDLVMHLRANLLIGGGVGGPDMSTGPIAHVKKKFSPPAPGDLGALDYADTIFSLLVAAVDLAAEELGMVGPYSAPAWRAGTSGYGVGGERGGNVAGLRPGSAGLEAAPYAQWLTVHLDEIVAEPWVVDFVSDADMAPGLVCLATAVHRASRAYEMVERPSYVNPALARVRCPTCGLKSLQRIPPSAPGAPVLMKCVGSSCNWVGTDVRAEEAEQSAPPIPSPRRAS